MADVLFDWLLFSYLFPRKNSPFSFKNKSRQFLTTVIRSDSIKSNNKKNVNSKIYNCSFININPFQPIWPCLAPK